MKATLSTTTAAHAVFSIKSARSAKASLKALDNINIDVMDISLKYRFDNASDRINFKSVVTGILYAVKTGRLNGAKEMELRTLTVWQFSKLVASMVNAGVKTEAAAVEYLRNN